MGAAGDSDQADGIQFGFGERLWKKRLFPDNVKEAEKLMQKEHESVRRFHLNFASSFKEPGYLVFFKCEKRFKASYFSLITNQ